MRLTSLSYAQFLDDPREWKLDGLTLRDLNLIVGKNASGKTRTVNVLWTLARLLSGVMKPALGSADYLVRFDHDGATLEYVLKVKDGRVTEERFEVGGERKLTRGDGGAGQIWANKLGQFLEFQAPQNEIATVVRRDELQHDFLEPLHAWAHVVLYYAFGTPLGRDRLGLFVSGPQDQPLDVRDPSTVVGIFHRALKAHGEAFKNGVRRDMKSIGYDLEDIGLCAPSTVAVSGGPPGQLLGLFVREASLGTVTEQLEMSQGMFRALSLIININFAALELNPSCILIDDIGEGLDFSRSCALIDLLQAKAGNKIQLIMTSNDRFVMNRVPLQAWTVLTRSGSTCRINNYDNSKQTFDDFSFTGLNNFDFFASDFVTTGGEEIGGLSEGK